jgi:hypothetical protein
MPSFFIRARSVLGWSSRIFAAPFDPSIIPLVCSSATTMWSLSTSSSGRGGLGASLVVRPDERDQAMTWLEKAYEERFNPSILQRPAFDPLRSDPRFQNLVRRIGLSS